MKPDVTIEEASAWLENHGTYLCSEPLPSASIISYKVEWKTFYGMHRRYSSYGSSEDNAVIHLYYDVRAHLFQLTNTDYKLLGELFALGK